MFRQSVVPRWRHFSFRRPIQISNFRRTANWLKTCGKKPSPATLSVALGVHLEEISELFDAIDIKRGTAFEACSAQLILLTLYLSSVADALKSGAAIATINDPEAALDALCDAEVTGNGVAYLAGWRKEGADDAVLASNESKLDANGKAVILPGGKIGKSDLYVKANIAPFVAAKKAKS